MKFVAPEIEVTKFDIVDVLTTSDDSQEMVNTAIFGIDECGPQLVDKEYS